MQGFVKSIAKKYFHSVLLGEIAALIYGNASLHELLLHVKSKKGLIRPYAALKFLTKLYEYTADRENNLPDFSDTFRRIYIAHMCVWGESYIDKLKCFMLPSLLASNNLPAISKDYKAIVMIHCDARARAEILKFPFMSKLNEHAILHFEVIPDYLIKLCNHAKNHWLFKGLNKIFGYDSGSDWNYYLLGALQNIAMRTSVKNKAYTSFFMPDNLISRDGLQVMLEAIKGKTAVATSCMSVVSTQLKEQIANEYRDNVLDLDAVCVTRLMVGNLHTLVKERIVSTKNYDFAATPQLFFSYPEAMIVRTLQYHPFLVDFLNAPEVVPSSYLPIDNIFLNNVIDFEKDLSAQVEVITDSDKLAIMEIREEVKKPTFNALRRINVEEAIANMLKFTSRTKLNDYFLRHRLVYKMHGVTNNYALSDIKDEELLSQNA